MSCRVCRVGFLSPRLGEIQLHSKISGLRFLSIGINQSIDRFFCCLCCVSMWSAIKCIDSLGLQVLVQWSRQKLRFDIVIIDWLIEKKSFHIVLVSIFGILGNKFFFQVYRFSFYLVVVHFLLNLSIRLSICVSRKLTLLQTISMDHMLAHIVH